jgi:cytidyltransferase-like protein
MSTSQVVVSGAFDDVRSHHLRFLEEAAKLGQLTAQLWSDELIKAVNGKAPKFPLAERLYFLNAVRYIKQVVVANDLRHPNELPDAKTLLPKIWVDEENPNNEGRKAFCGQSGIDYRMLKAEQLKGFPEPLARPSTPGRKKVFVTGCYDWFHTGHVRFFEEVSAYGDLYVIVGNDANLCLLKGPGHPLLHQEERRYVAGSIKYVTQSLVSTGTGWLDADPEIRRIKPDIYAVNEDGDKGGKREYCQSLGLEYLVLKRTPAPGLQKRSSTDLRGF